MEDSERQALILELNKLSEFEEQNLERMKEIAHVLVADYMHKDGRTTKQANRERVETFWNKVRQYMSLLCKRQKNSNKLL